MARTTIASSGGPATPPCSSPAPIRCSPAWLTADQISADQPSRSAAARFRGEQAAESTSSAIAASSASDMGQALGHNRAEDLDSSAAQREGRCSEDRVGKESLEERVRRGAGLDLDKGPKVLEQVLLKAGGHFLNHRGLDRGQLPAVQGAGDRQRELTQRPQLPCGGAEEAPSGLIEAIVTMLSQVLLHEDVRGEPTLRARALVDELRGDLRPAVPQFAENLLGGNRDVRKADLAEVRLAGQQRDGADLDSRRRPPHCPL